jgi:hypothetical protein
MGLGNTFSFIRYPDMLGNADTYGLPGYYGKVGFWSV